MSFPTSTYGTSNDEQVIIPIATPEVKLDKRLKDELLSQIQEESMVIVHCSFTAEITMNIRIWNSTFLIDHHSGNRSRLLHAENISIAPVWMHVEGGTTARFTLIFASLPKSCDVFDMYEDIPEEGGFHIKGIRRNKSDVYNVDVV
jgi:hypothetical protein